MKTIFTFLMLILFSITNAQDKIYVHTATAANSSGWITYLDHPDLNGNPNAGIVYKHVWNPNGAGGVYNDNVDGLWYNGSQWTIFNEDAATTMVDGAQFFIYIAADPADVITHIADVAHQGSIPAYTEIDNPLFNGSNPGPYAIMSNYWNPFSVYNNHNYGFWYDTGSNRRVIYSEDIVDIPENAAFKILVSGDATNYFTHESDAGNIAGNWTVIDHASLNGNPNATFVFSHYYGINGASSQVEIDKVLSAWYTGSNWAIYTEDNSAMPEGIALDIIVADQEILGNEDFDLETNISMSPNPAREFTTISTTQEISTIEIFNLLGQELSQIQGSGKTMQIDLTNLAAGNYFIKVQVEGASETLKLIKL